MKRFKLYFSALILWLCFTPLTHYGGEINQERFGFYLNGKKSSVKIPFKFHANLIIVQVSLNDGSPLNFILDSGVNSIIIFDKASVKDQKLIVGRKVPVSGVGSDHTLEAQISIGNKIAMNTIIAFNQNLLILDENKLQLSEFIGFPIHGIFGYDIFKNFTVSINFHQKELTVYNKDRFHYTRKKGEQIPIRIANSKPLVEAVVHLPDQTKQDIKLVIDTGAGHALFLDRFQDDNVPLPEKLIDTQLGRGLNGMINGKLGRIEKLTIGNTTLQKVLTSFPDSLDFGSKLVGGVERHGNIGCEILRRFIVTFNYQENYLVLKPTKKSIFESFEHDMSGMEIKAVGENYSQIIISHIFENSPAEQAGLKEGDQLLFINDRPISELSLSELNKILQKGDGKEVSIIAQRGKELFSTAILLKRLI